MLRRHAPSGTLGSSALPTKVCPHGTVSLRRFPHDRNRPACNASKRIRDEKNKSRKASEITPACANTSARKGLSHPLGIISCPFESWLWRMGGFEFQRGCPFLCLLCFLFLWQNQNIELCVRLMYPRFVSSLTKTSFVNHSKKSNCLLQAFF